MKPVGYEAFQEVPFYPNVGIIVDIPMEMYMDNKDNAEFWREWGEQK